MSMRPGYYVMGLNSGMEWVSEEQAISYHGHELRLRPETNDAAPSIVVEISDSLSQLDAEKILREFLSGYSWIRGTGVSELFSSFNSAAPVTIGKSQCRMINDAPVEHIPALNDPKARLALALYREAMAVNLIPYKLLGFFKVLNVVFPNGPAQKEWINSVLEELNDSQVVLRISEIRSNEGDVGYYLYTSGRCAVAHAYNDPLVNPDAPDDLRRLSKDLPVVKALAETLIEKKLGVRSYSTILEEHLYELEGFRDLFGERVVQLIKAGDSVCLDDVFDSKRLSIRLQGIESIESFESVVVTKAVAADGIVQLCFQNLGGLLVGKIHLVEVPPK